MPKPELGTKRQCQNCGAKFFDLAKDPIVCPKCGTVYQVAPLPTRASARAKAVEEEEPEAEPAEAELVSLEEADAGEDEKVAAALPEDNIEVEEDEAAEDDTFLEEEEEDSSDVSNLIDGDIEGDEER
ncbi:MAG: TIGR02300 family protein [Methylobacteriaceae bacterium]|nr:TIGR02300 family protein [Methylobacteriaceae bacterium]